MAMLIRPRSWGTTKPVVGAQIDWSHPLARGLAICVLLNEGGGGPLELVRGGRSGVNGGAGGGAVVPDAPFIATSGLSLLWRGRIDQLAADKGGVFAGKHFTNGATNNPFDFRVANSGFSEGSDSAPRLVRANAAG